MPLNVRTRLTLWHVATMALILAVCAFGIYSYVRESLFALIDERLEKSLAIILVTVQDNPARLSEIERHLHVLPFRIQEGDRPLYESTDWTAGKLNFAGNAPTAGRWIFATSGGVYHLKEKSARAGDRIVLIRTAKSGDQIHYDIDRLRLTLIGGFPVALLLSLLGGYFLTGRALAPMQHLARRAQAIGVDNLSERLAVPNAHDEIGQLTTVLNATFGRLEDSFTRLKRFTQDAAHELRTPLAVLRSTGEVGLHARRDSDGYREVIGSMLEEGDRLARLVDGLLTLAQADAGTLSLDRKPEDVAVLCREVADCLRVLAEDKQQTLSCLTPEGLHAIVNRDTLSLALINIVANAVCFTPARGEIRIGCMADGVGGVTIEVSDNGPGIAKKHHGRLFERFYRVDASRSHQTGGAGLGLAIARWAVETNGGHIEVDSDVGRGSRFRIVLPHRDVS